MYYYDSDMGVFMGEVSVEMLEDLRIFWVIFGYSERRNFFNELNEFVGKKVVYVWFYGLFVIVCVGEMLEE